MESGRMTTQRWPSFSSLATFTAAAMAVPELPPVTGNSRRLVGFNSEFTQTSAVHVSGNSPHSRPSSLISIRDMLKDSSSTDLYQVSITWKQASCG